jgi:hypothetical protein
MLSYLVKNWKDVTYHIEDDPEVNGKANVKNDNPVEDLKNTKL